MEKLLETVVIPKQMEGLPEGFDEKALDGLDIEGKLDFLSRFKAAMPVKAPETRKVGVEIPAKKTEAVGAPTPGSMVERAARAKEILLENKKSGKPGLIGNEVYL